MSTPRPDSAAPQSSAKPPISVSPLTVRLFGPMQVLIHGQLLPPLHSRKSLWLLALLILRHGRPVEREWLAATLWPDSDPRIASTNLRNSLSTLRGSLGDQAQRLQTPNRHSVQLDLSDADLLAFDAAIQRDPERAVALYSGPLVEGCTEEWMLAERSARALQCRQALQQLGEDALSEGSAERAARFFARAVGLDPWNDAARRGWMEALAKNGDTNAALQVYREFVDFLRDHPGVVPDAPTSALYQRLRAQARQRTGSPASVGVGPPVEKAAVPEVKGYLPHPLTELVGREDERRAVALELRHSRLVTLTGVGGIGKTRLARAVAGAVVTEYADGVWLVTLEALTEGRLVAGQIASVLGVKEERNCSPLLSVTDYLRPKRLLLVLDNCEHLREASAEVAAHLLQECPEVRILATSREALGISGEAVWSVPPLPVPDTQRLPEGQSTLLHTVMGYESVQLFVERAEAVRKTFSLSGSNALLVARACQQLEGIPLAIELAAARVRVMTVAQIASRLDEHLRLLTGGSRPAHPRQQTLRATLDWSYALLTEAERSLLKRLSVFAGGWNLEAAVQVCTEGVGQAEVSDLLASLVDKSLVVFREQDAGGRYRLLEMVRQYAAEALEASGEAEPVKRKHRDWFLALAEAAEPELRGPEQVDWLHRLEADHDNLRAAMAWCEAEEEGVRAGLRLAGALHWFWHMRGDYAEGRASLGRVLAREEAQEATVERAKALNGAGALAFRQGDYALSRALIEEALTIQRASGDKAGIGFSLHHLGNVSQVQGEYAAARTYYEESLALHREIGERAWEARNLDNLGTIAQHAGESTVAAAYYEESLAIKRQLGDRSGMAHPISRLGQLALARGEYAAARACFEESLAIRREIGDRRGVAVELGNLGQVAQAQGEYAAAQAYFEESLPMFREIGDRRGIAAILITLGRVSQSQGDYATARARFEESLAINREMGDRAWEAMNLDNLGNVARQEGNYAAARTLLEEGKRIIQELGDRTGIATMLNSLGDVEIAVGDFAAARPLYAESLQLFQMMGHPVGVAKSLEGLAGVMLGVAEASKAARLWGAAYGLRDSVGAALPSGERAMYDRQVAQARSALGDDAFAVAWEEGRAMTREQAVAYALGEAAE